MDKQTLLALIVWAIDTDRTGYSVVEAWEEFQKDAIGIKSNYTDPTDEHLYLPSVVEQDPIEFFTDYVLFHAKTRLLANKTSCIPQPKGALYGNYESQILNYKI